LDSSKKNIIRQIVSLNNVLYRTLCKLIALYWVLKNRNTNTVKLNGELQYINSFLIETISQFYKNCNIIGKNHKTLTNINSIFLSRYFEGDEQVIEKVDQEFLKSVLIKLENILIETNKHYEFFLFDTEDIFPPNPKIVKAVEIFLKTLNRNKKYPKLLTLVNFSQNFITKNSWKNYLNRISFRIYLLKSLDEKTKLSDNLKNLIVNECHFIITKKLLQDYNYLKRNKLINTDTRRDTLILKFKWENIVFGKRQIVKDANKISELINKIEYHSLEKPTNSSLIGKSHLNTSTENKWNEKSNKKLKLSKRKIKNVKKVSKLPVETLTKEIAADKFNWVVEKSKLNKLFSLLIHEGFLSQSLTSNLDNLITQHMVVKSEDSIFNKIDNFEPIRWEKRLIDLVYLVISLYSKGFFDYKQKGQESILIYNHFATKNGSPLKLNSIKQTKTDLLNDSYKRPKSKDILDYIINELSSQ